MWSWNSYLTNLDSFSEMPSMSSWFGVEISWLPMDLSLSLLKESGKMLNKARISLNHHCNHSGTLPLGKDKQRFDMNGRQPQSLSRCGHKFNLDGQLGCAIMCQYMLNRLTGKWYITWHQNVLPVITVIVRGKFPVHLPTFSIWLEVFALFSCKHGRWPYWKESLVFQTDQEKQHFQPMMEGL